MLVYGLIPFGTDSAIVSKAAAGIAKLFINIKKGIFKKNLSFGAVHTSLVFSAVDRKTTSLEIDFTDSSFIGIEIIKRMIYEHNVLAVVYPKEKVFFQLGEILKNIPKVIVDWNIGKKYNLGKHNCQDFVLNLLSSLGIDLFKDFTGMVGLDLVSKGKYFTVPFVGNEYDEYKEKVLDYIKVRERSYEFKDKEKEKELLVTFKTHKSLKLFMEKIVGIEKKVRYMENDPPAFFMIAKSV